MNEEALELILGAGMKSRKHPGVRIDPELHDKMHFVAHYEGYSGNGLMLHPVRRRIAEYEKEHGEIKVADEL